MTEAQKLKKTKLLALGCKADPDVECVVWYGAHCFMICPDGSLEEL